MPRNATACSWHSEKIADSTCAFSFVICAINGSHCEVPLAIP
jgi:hypothetical protein